MRITPPRSAPARALVSKLVRIVEVEVINHVAVAQRMLRQQVRNVGVIRPGGDDRILRRGLANGRRHSRLNPRPTVGVIHLRLVHDLEEHPLRIARGKVRRQPPPQHRQPVDCLVAGAQGQLVTLFRMQVDGDRQAVGQHGIHRAVESRHKVRVEPIAAARTLLQRRRVDAQPHIVETQLRHQRNVVGVGVGIRVMRGIIGSRLRKPVRHVDAPLQMLRPGKCRVPLGRTALCQSGKSREHDQKKYETTRKSAHGEDSIAEIATGPRYYRQPRRQKRNRTSS